MNTAVKAAWFGERAFSPLNVDSLALWLDASDESTITHSSGSVSQWDDKSGNANHVSQGTASLQPTTNASTLNSKNVIDFAGDYLAAALVGDWVFLHDGTSYTAFAVWKAGVSSNPDAAYGLMGTNAGSAENIGANVFFDDRSGVPRNEKLIHFVSDGSVSVVDNKTGDGFWTPNESALLTIEADPDNATASSRSALSRNAGTAVENNSASGTPSASNPTYPLQVGAIGNGVVPLAGHIAELLIYNSALSSGDVSSVESYLADKWGITI